METRTMIKKLRCVLHFLFDHLPCHNKRKNNIRLHPLHLQNSLKELYINSTSILSPKGATHITSIIATICISFVITTPHCAMAQKKKQASYYDSIVSKKYDTAVADTNSMELDETEIIDKVFLENNLTNYPSPIWYGRNFSDSRVRIHNNSSLDSLPDEIRIKLVKDSTGFCFPIKNFITSPYGWRERWNRPHRGVDIALRTGDKIYCCFDGIVRIARPLGAYGNLVVVRHYNGLETVYGHLSKIYVKPKEKVLAGTVLGLGGSTGRSTGPHLHFEVRFQYEAFDPEWILDFETYTLRTRKLYLDKTYFGIKKPKNKKEQAIYKADKSIIKEDDPNNEKPKYIQYKEPKYHIAKKGDTWEKLSKRYRVSVKRLKRLNSADKDYIKPGTKIRIN